MHAPLPMLTITDQGTSSEQLSTQICILITSGQLLPGTRLPSVRSLANTLHLAPNTVVNAYHALERGGWLPRLVARQQRWWHLHPHFHARSSCDHYEEPSSICWRRLPNLV